MNFCTKQDIRDLSKWLKSYPATKMAYLLGYKNSHSVTQWVTKGDIPDYMVGRVREIIQKDMQNEQQSNSAG